MTHTTLFRSNMGSQDMLDLYQKYGVPGYLQEFVTSRDKGGGTQIVTNDTRQFSGILCSSFSGWGIGSTEHSRGSDLV